MDASAINENKWKVLLSMDASAENKWISIVKYASAINENKWISIVKYGCQCNKWK